MLIATITTLVLVFGVGGAAELYNSWFDSISSAFSKNIEDEQRATESEAIIEKMRAHTSEQMAGILEQRRRVLLVDGNADATAEDYRRVLTELVELWVQSERKLIDARFELRDKVTRQEWNAAFVQIRKDLPWKDE